MMSVNEKATALFEMGMVRLTQFDTYKRLTGADVAARNLDVAQVKYLRRTGIAFVVSCRHKSADGPSNDHDCEGHTHGHVCYHARAGLMMSAGVSNHTLTFHETREEAEATGEYVLQVMVPNQFEKAVWGSLKPKE